MPKLQLTKRNIDSKTPFTESGQVDYWDTELKGLGLRVGKDTKTFYVKVDVPDSGTGKYKSVKGKLGRYGEITPDEARKKAPAIMAKLRAGKTVDDAPIPTLRRLYQKYIEVKNLKPNTVAAYKIYFENEKGAKFSSWMDIPAPELIQMLRPDVVIARYQDVLSLSGKGAASNSFKMLQAIINYGMILFPQYISRNPVKVITDAELWPEIKTRTTFINPEQFKVFHDALLSFPAIHRDCYLFALYQGLRPDEAHSLRWEDVDLEKKLFDLTWKDSETKHRGALPLSRQTAEILRRRHNVRQEGSIYVFPSGSGRSSSGHVMLRADKLRAKTGLDITPHSLRRTFIQIGEKRVKIARESVKFLTNHLDRSVHGEHYAHLDVEDVRAPLQAIANEIERLMVHGIGGEVAENRENSLT